MKSILEEQSKFLQLSLKRQLKEKKIKATINFRTIKDDSKK